MAQPICPNCKYNGDRACAVNPRYWEQARKLGLHSDRANEDFSLVVQLCPDYEAPELVAIEISLPLTTIQQAIKGDRTAIGLVLREAAKAIGLEEEMKLKREETLPERVRREIEQLNLRGRIVPDPGLPPMSPIVWRGGSSGIQVAFNDPLCLGE